MEHPTIPIPKLPNDVIVDILLWLPVKSLLKFRCVCKSWRTLISSQQFVMAHLQNSKLDPNFTTHRLITKCRGNVKQCSVNSVLYEPVSEAFDLSCPVKLEEYYDWVVGSCNGLICLSIDEKELILWNPSTRIYRELPDFGVEINFESHFDYGFGFDKSSDDYKVVGLLDKDSGLSEWIVQVYSLRNDRWKRIDNFLNRTWDIDAPATFVNGKLYWIANENCDEDEYIWHIVSFDLEKEEAEILQLPSFVKSCQYARLGMGASEGSLLVLCSHTTSADVWMMDGGGVGDEKWTKVVTMPYIDDMLEYYKMVVYAKNGRVLFVLDTQYAFVIVDAKECSISYPEVRNLGDDFEVALYLESLVSPLG